MEIKRLESGLRISGDACPSRYETVVIIHQFKLKSTRRVSEGKSIDDKWTCEKLW